MSYATTTPVAISRARRVNSESGRDLNARVAQPQHTAQAAPSLLAIAERALDSERTPALAHPRLQRAINRAEIALASPEAETAHEVYPAPPRGSYFSWLKRVPRLPEARCRPPPPLRARSEPCPAATPLYPVPRRRNAAKPNACSAPSKYCTCNALPLGRAPLGAKQDAHRESDEFGVLLAPDAEQLRGTPREVDEYGLFV